MGQIQDTPLASQQALKEVQTMQILSVTDSHHSQHTTDTCEQAVNAANAMARQTYLIDVVV